LRAPRLRGSCSELVVAGGNLTEVLEAAEGILDKVAAAVAILVVMDGAFAVAATGDDRNSACITQRAPQLVDIIALISQHVAHAPGALEKRWRGFDVAHDCRS